MTTPALPSDPPVRLLDLPSGPLAITDVGQGPPLLLVHGAPGSVRDWRWLGPVLEPHLRTIRIDFPGFGSSPASTAPRADLQTRGELTLAVADALGLQRFALLGHSQGGAVAMHVAAHHPDRVSGLALVGSVGLRPHRQVRPRWLLRLIALALRGRVSRWLLMPILRRSFGAIGFPRSTPDHSMVQTMQWTANLDFPANRANVARLTMPTLLASTDDDPFITPRISEELAGVLPPGPRLRWPQGGHNMQKTCATELGQALVEWLAPT